MGSDSRSARSGSLFHSAANSLARWRAPRAHSWTFSSILRSTPSIARPYEQPTSSPYSMMISFLAPLLAKDLALSPTDIGKIFGVGYVGAIVGAIAVGSLADWIGRKPMLVASLVLASVATMACANATSLGILTILRFLAGLALGGALPALISLTAEHAEPERRNG